MLGTAGVACIDGDGIAAGTGADERVVPLALGMAVGLVTVGGRTGRDGAPPGVTGPRRAPGGT